MENGVVQMYTETRTLVAVFLTTVAMLAVEVTVLATIG